MDRGGEGRGGRHPFLRPSLLTGVALYARLCTSTRRASISGRRPSVRDIIFESESNFGRRSFDRECEALEYLVIRYDHLIRIKRKRIIETIILRFQYEARRVFAQPSPDTGRVHLNRAERRERSGIDSRGVREKSYETILPEQPPRIRGLARGRGCSFQRFHEDQGIYDLSSSPLSFSFLLQFFESRSKINKP